MMRLWSNVIAAVRDNARPFSVAEFSIWILMLAMMVPTNCVVVLRVAELVTRQNTWHGWAPPIRTTFEADAVTSVVGAAVVPIRKM